MTGDLVKAMRACPQPIIAAIDGVCAGAGAIIAMASDLRYAAPSAKVAFLFVRVGLAGCDMGACAMLPRIIGQGRAAELLYTGRSMSAEEGEPGASSTSVVEPVLAEGARPRERARRGPDLGARDDQEDAAPGVGRGRRRGDRGRSAGAGDPHADARISAAPTRRSWRSRSRASRATDGPASRTRLAVLRRRHAKLAREADAWARDNLAHAHGEDADAICRALVQDLGCAGYLAPLRVGARPTCARSRCCARCSPTTPGSPTSPSPCRAWAAARSRSPAAPQQKERYLRRAAAGEAIAAFALSEPEAGSDVQALMTTRAARRRRLGARRRKTWISNGGIADFYVVFAQARTRASAPSSSRPSEVDASRAHRRPRAASAGDA